ncbi:hypothetical protein FOA52_006694 [Chlamydomonas sp. UWO 241]|nr:hypothetical protein FOA52_006694 [Chlamydomonas sp. UWO 241]
MSNEVLFSLDLWAQQLWRWLDRDAKVALRSVSQAMRSQVDGSIQVVVSPSAGCSGDELALALTRWPCVRHLTLLNVSGASDLAPLSTASLAGLASLTVREAAHAEAWDMQAPSSTAAVTLRVLDLSGCVGLRSIDAICSCVELRHAGNKGASAANGAIPALMKLLGPDLPARVRIAAADALRNLAANHAQNHATITAAGTVAALLQMLDPGSSTGVQEAATRALRIINAPCIVCSHKI